MGDPKSESKCILEREREKEREREREREREKEEKKRERKRASQQGATPILSANYSD